jgi:hypothetical protein
MTMPAQGNYDVKWHVTSQNLTTTISDSGTGFESVWEVRYAVDSGPATGTTGTVRVPAAQYNAANVKAAIDAQVYHVHNVAGLGQ